jgi:hypothetical protein
MLNLNREHEKVLKELTALKKLQQQTQNDLKTQNQTIAVVSDDKLKKFENCIANNYSKATTTSIQNKTVLFNVTNVTTGFFL